MKTTKTASKKTSKAPLESDVSEVVTQAAEAHQSTPEEVEGSSEEEAEVETNPVITSHLTDEALVQRYVDLGTRANRLRPQVSEARKTLSAARKAMEESPAFRAWQQAHDQVKALGTCRALDSEAHVLQLVAKERGLKLPKLS